MSLLIKKPVFFLLLFVSLISCDDANDLGTSFEGSLINAAYTDTVTVTAATVLAPVDSVVSYQKGNLLAGTFTNGPFGVTTAKAYLEIGPSGGSFPANSTLDSVVLALDYNEYYGDTLQDYTLQVHELTKAFETDKTYYTTNNNNLTYAEAPLGVVTFKPTPKRTISKTVGSSTVKASVPVRIKLNNELGQRILALPATALSSTAEFARTFKGVVLAPGANTNAALGFAPNGANANADSTYLRIYYTTADSKKQRYELPIRETRTSSGTIEGNDRFNEIIYNRSNTPLATLQQAGDSLAATGGETYLQESTGILTKISFPHLPNFTAKLANGNLTVNRAELIIPVKENAASVPAPLAYLIPTTPSNRIPRASNLAPLYLPEDPAVNPGSTTRNPAVVRYDATKKAYVANVTQYVQGLMANRPTIAGNNVSYLTSKSLLLWPSSGTGILETSGLAQSILQTSGSNQIKLRIYFSRIN